MNRRPLTYVEDDVELPLLTPQQFLYQRSTQLPEQTTHQINDLDIRSRAKYLKSCKDQLWQRWKKEYLVALRERHKIAHKKPKYQPEVGNEVIVKSDSKNRACALKESWCRSTLARMTLSEQSEYEPLTATSSERPNFCIRSNCTVILSRQPSTRRLKSLLPDQSEMLL